MTKKRNHVKPAPPRWDGVFKAGLLVLFITALAVTFWPRQSEVPPGAVADRGPDPAASGAGSAPAPAPAAPKVLPATGASLEPPVAATITERADALLVEKLLQSDSVAELNQFGNTLLTRGDFTNAARAFRRAVELDDKSEINHFNLGLALARLQQTNEAIAQYRTALEIYPDYAEAHNSLGLQLAAQGKLDEARKHYAAAIEIQPDFATALNNLGTVLARQQRYAEALPWFEKAVNQDTNYVDARFNFANALVQVGRKDEAIGRLQDLINQFPNHRPAQLVLMRLTASEQAK